MTAKKPTPQRIDDNNPELTREELRRAGPAAEVLPRYIVQKATDEVLREHMPRREK